MDTPASPADRAPPNRRRGLGLVIAAAFMLLATVWLWPETAEDPELFAPVASDDVPQLVRLGPDVSPHETLGGPTGVTLVALTATGLEFIDLDTGRRTTVRIEAPIAPAEAMGGRILAVGDTVYVAPGTEIWAVDIGTGFASPTIAGSAVAPSRTSGRLWVLGADNEDRERWTEIDAAGTAIRSMSPPPGARAWDHGLGTPEVAWVPTAGIFVLADDGTWQLVGKGAPVAGNGVVAIEQRCDASGSCSFWWIDLATGDEIDRPLPPTLDRPGERTMRLSPSGSQVLEVFPQDDGTMPTHLFAESFSRHTACDGGWRTAAWSADESVLACADGETVTVVDVTRGTITAFAMDSETYGVVAVATDAVGVR